MVNSGNDQLLVGLALINEVGTATQLLATGLNLIVDPDWYASEPAAALTCMASGVERIMKLTYGVHLRDLGDAFPSTNELKKLGHNLVALNHLVQPILGAGAARLRDAYVARLLRGSTSDPYWPGILRTLDAWAATAGRYRDLDILAGSWLGDDPPQALWGEVEQRSIEDLGLLAEVSGPHSREALVRARTRLAESVLTWWFAVFRSWTHGVLGQDQKSPGTLLSPTDTRELATPLKAMITGW